MAGNFLSRSANLVSLLACINLLGASAGPERCVFVQQGLATVTEGNTFCRLWCFSNSLATC